MLGSAEVRGPAGQAEFQHNGSSGRGRRQGQERPLHVGRDPTQISRQRAVWLEWARATSRNDVIWLEPEGTAREPRK